MSPFIYANTYTKSKRVGGECVQTEHDNIVWKPLCIFKTTHIYLLIHPFIQLVPYKHMIHPYIYVHHNQLNMQRAICTRCMCAYLMFAFSPYASTIITHIPNHVIFTPRLYSAHTLAAEYVIVVHVHSAYAARGLMTAIILRYIRRHTYVDTYIQAHKQHICE